MVSTRRALIAIGAALTATTMIAACGSGEVGSSNNNQTGAQSGGGNKLLFFLRVLKDQYKKFVVDRH